MDIIPDDIESKRKEAIIDEYHTLCKELVPYLRVLINSKMPGNIGAVFETFKLHLDALFMLTCDKKGLNEKILTPTREWIDKRHVPSLKDIRDGLKLFDDYKAELFRMNVL